MKILEKYGTRIARIILHIAVFAQTVRTLKYPAYLVRKSLWSDGNGGKVIRIAVKISLQ